MDPREMETLVRRLVQNPHDQQAITYAHQAGQSDPRSYALLLEKVGTATSDPAIAIHWLTEAANVWSSTLGDAHRAARALMNAIDRDPTQPLPAERLAELYREKGDYKALVSLLEMRAKALAQLAQQEPEVRAHVAAVYEELGRVWSEAPLSQPSKAIESYRKAIEYDPNSIYAIYGIRELHKALGQWTEALPYFAMEQALVTDPERKLALYQDEAEVRRQAGDLTGMTNAAREACHLDGGRDPALKQLLGAAILERVRAGERVKSSELAEGAALFLELAEQYPGEHGYSYAHCALELDPGSDRGIQLAIYFGSQLGRLAEVAPRAAAYLRVNPNGLMAAEAAEVAGSARPGADAGVGLGWPVVAGAAPDEDRVRSLLDDAEALVQKARKNEAAKLYREVLDLDPANVEAMGFMENYLRQTRKFAELRDLLLTAARIPSADEEMRRNWLREVAGLCETQLRDMDTAIGAWQTLLSLDPDDETPRTQLRRLLEKAQRWDELAGLLEREAQQEGDLEVRISIEKALAKIHEQKRKDLVATGETWARIASLTPSDEQALVTAIRFLEKGGRPDLAAQVISENISSVEDEVHRAQLYRKLGELRQAAGDLLGAGEAFSEGAALSQDPKLWEAAEKCFLAAQAWDQAANAIESRAQSATEPKLQAQLFATEAEYLLKAGDESSAVLKLEQATDLDPGNETYAKLLEDRYTEGARIDELAAFLLKRAEQLPSKERRVELRKRAATIQRQQLGDPEAARASLIAVLSDGDDVEALELLVEDAEAREAYAEAVDYLSRLGRAHRDRAKRMAVLAREARLVADGLDDVPGAIERYERLLAEFDPNNQEVLEALAELYERNDNPEGQAGALERLLGAVSDPAKKLELAQQLSILYEERLDDPANAVRVLKLVRELDKGDFDALARLCALSERLEDWPRVAEYMASLIEVEGDEREVGRMTRRLAEILYEKLGKGDEALAVLVEVADAGDEEARADYVKLGDLLGWKGIVATKLVEWNMEAPASPERNEALEGAFRRFLEVERLAEAAQVGTELVRSRGADLELAQKLEQIAVELKDLDALAAAHDLMVQDLSGPPRAEEMVRQAEILRRAGVDPVEAIQHGEQALTSVDPAEVEPLLARLAKLSASSDQVIDIYERQVSRCRALDDRLRALGRAAQVACEYKAFERARGFLDLALAQGGAQDEVFALLEDVAREWDQNHSETKLRRILCEALANGGQGARDGGRTRATMLRRAAQLVYDDLDQVDQALGWLGDSLIAHVDDTGLDALENLALEVGDPKLAEKVLDRALEEVFDGPLVRKLLARRAALRRERLDDRAGAAADLKRLHDLSPADSAVTEELLALYTELEDYRGMVQLYEDQILRSKDPNVRAELARKVARLWEEHLRDPREAADAWRRVLRMKSGDAEATAGLERAKSNMLKKPSGGVTEEEPAEAGEASTGQPASRPLPSAGPALTEQSRAEAVERTATPSVRSGDSRPGPAGAQQSAAPAQRSAVPPPPPGKTVSRPGAPPPPPGKAAAPPVPPPTPSGGPRPPAPPGPPVRPPPPPPPLKSRPPPHPPRPPAPQKPQVEELPVDDDLLLEDE